MKQQIELSDNDLDTIKVALRKCIKINEMAMSELSKSQTKEDKVNHEYSSPQNEVMQELHDRIEKMELSK